jgi:hypothetical protein
MTHSSYFLFDDRTFIEILGRVVGSGANQLDPSTMSLSVRSCSSKGGQERVMNVDDSIPEWPYNLGAQDTHVSGQNDQVHPETCQNIEHRRLLFSPVIGSGWKLEVWEAEVLGGIGVIRPVTDHSNHLAGKVSGRPPRQQIIKAMPQTRHHDGNAPGLVRKAQTPLYVHLGCEAREALSEFETAHSDFVNTEFNPLKEDPGLLVSVLVGMNDVSPQPPDEVSYSRDQPFLVWT